MISDEIIIAGIIAVPPTLASVAAVVMAWRAGNKVQEVHMLMNSRFDEWKKMMLEVSHREGVDDERKRAEGVALALEHQKQESKPM